MNIEIDYSPTPSNSYFISVCLNDTEAISFDYSSKGHRVTKQVLTDHKQMQNDQKITGEWDTLVIKNGKFVKRYHVRWVDMDRKDWVNDEIWDTVAEKPLSTEIKDQLLRYSQLISDKYEHLDTIQNEVNNLQSLLKIEVDKFLN